MINLRYFCFVVIQLYLKVRALALFYFINLHHYTYITKPHIPDTSGCLKNIRFRCIQKKNTSKLHKIRQSRCIHPSKFIKLSNPRCHIILPEADLRANHSELQLSSAIDTEFTSIRERLATTGTELCAAGSLLRRSLL